MIVLSDDGANAALDAIGTMLNGGSIEMLTAAGDLVVTLQLSNPAAMPAADGGVGISRNPRGYCCHHRSR